MVSPGVLVLIGSTTFHSNPPGPYPGGGIEIERIPLLIISSLSCDRLLLGSGLSLMAGAWQHRDKIIPSRGHNRLLAGNKNRVRWNIFIHERHGANHHVIANGD